MESHVERMGRWDDEPFLIDCQNGLKEPKGVDGTLGVYSVAVPSGYLRCIDSNFEWKA
jgi:hypothetical protein